MSCSEPLEVIGSTPYKLIFFFEISSLIFEKCRSHEPSTPQIKMEVLYKDAGTFVHLFFFFNSNSLPNESILDLKRSI